MQESNVGQNFACHWQPEEGSRRDTRNVIVVLNKEGEYETKWSNGNEPVEFNQFSHWRVADEACY